MEPSRRQCAELKLQIRHSHVTPTCHLGCQHWRHAADRPLPAARPSRRPAARRCPACGGPLRGPGRDAGGRAGAADRRVGRGSHWSGLGVRGSEPGSFDATRRVRRRRRSASWPVQGSAGLAGRGRRSACRRRHPQGRSRSTESGRAGRGRRAGARPGEAPARGRRGPGRSHSRRPGGADPAELRDGGAARLAARNRPGHYRVAFTPDYVRGQYARASRDSPLEASPTPANVSKT
jgi:hypothetical protein